MRSRHYEAKIRFREAGLSYGVMQCDAVWLSVFLANLTSRTRVARPKARNNSSTSDAQGKDEKCKTVNECGEFG
jgi:hypothetical protein